MERENCYKKDSQTTVHSFVQGLLEWRKSIQEKIIKINSELPLFVAAKHTFIS